MVRSKYSIEIARILLDGQWHTTTSIAILVRGYIRPEVAYRRLYHFGTIRSGYTNVVWHVLRRWMRINKVESRIANKISEWRIIDREYFKKILKGG